LTRLLGFLAGSWRWVVLSVLLGMLTVGSGVGLMGTSAFLLSSAALHPALGSLQVAIAGVRFFGIARGVFRYAERLATHDTTFRLLARLRTWFYRALEPLAPARLLHFRSGDLLAGIVADVDQLENFYVRAVAPPLVGVTVTAGMAVFLGKLSFSLAAAYLGFSCLLGIGVPALSWVINRRTGSLVVSHRAELQAYLVDAIRGLAEILVFNRRLDWSDRMALIGVPYDRVQRRLAVHYGISGALSVLLVNCCMLTVLLFAIPLVSEGQITGVMLAVVVVTALAGMEAVQSLPQSALALSSSLGSARRLFNVVDTEAEIRDSLPVPASAGQVTPSAHPGLAVEALTFTYPGQDQPALQEITFSLEPGKRIAFVGSSGAGKSTLVNLLLRFWEYHHGHIQMDGIDLRALPADLVRCFFSVASQRSHLFDDTIRRNLLLAKPEADELEMQAACRQAQVHDFIQHLPNDYDTRVNEASSRLSRGERQRLILARAFLKDAPILLLDEPTANLDTVTERALLDLLLASNSQHSLLWFTHRLVAMEQLDEICVLDRGRLVERGSHAQLLSRNGIYALLWDVQNRYLPSVESIEHL
jgi:ATP-binding cassette subfamily C protein CydC